MVDKPIVNPPVPHLPIGTTPPVNPLPEPVGKAPVRFVQPPPSNPTPAVSAKVSANVAEKMKLKEVRRTEILKIMAETVEEYGGEANVPLDHIYWSLGNEFRSLGS